MGDESSGRSQQLLKGKRVLYREEPATLFFKVKQQADFQFSTGEQIVVIRSAGHFLHAPTGKAPFSTFWNSTHAQLDFVSSISNLEENPEEKPLRTLTRGEIAIRQRQRPILLRIRNN